MTTIDPQALTQQLRAHLDRGGVWRFVQTFTSKGGRTHWEPTTAPFEIPFKAAHKAQAYWGVNPTAVIVTDEDRAKSWAQGKSDDQIGPFIASKNRTVCAVNALYAEFDGKDETQPTDNEIAAQRNTIDAKRQSELQSGKITSMPAESSLQAEALALAKEVKFLADIAHYKALALDRVYAAPLAPSVIIDSGGGYQAYWLLGDTYAIESDTQRNHIARLQAGWVQLVGGDMGAKDLRRILRVPGLRNLKKAYGPNFPEVCYVHADLDLLYTIDDFSALVPAEAEPKTAQRSTLAGHFGASGSSVIDAFNERYGIVEMLERQGYTLHGDRMVKPGGKNATVAIYEDDNQSYHHGGEDPLHNSHRHDPFSVYSYYEHGGDNAKAVKAAAELLGMAHTYTNGHSKRAAMLQTENGHDVDPTTGEIIEGPAPDLTVDEVTQAIGDIATDKALQPADRKRRIIKELAFAVGSLERSDHALVIESLERADANFAKTDAKAWVAGCVADAKARRKEQERQRKEEARQNLLTVRAAKGKRSIDVGNRQLSDIVGDAMQALIEDNGEHPKTFVRGGALVRIGKDEREHVSIQEYGTGALLAKLADVADWETVSTDADGNPKTQAVFPPRDAIAALLGAPEWPGIPPLAGIVSSPIFAKDGELHSQPGYNPNTRLFYTGGVKVGHVKPTPENVAWAKDLILNELLGDFAFKDEASRAHTVAYLLSPFVRDMIHGATPIHVVDSPSPGTGKGLLLNACAYLALGHDASTMAAAKDDDEWRKRLTTSFMRGATHLVIDNVNHTLDSGVLASALTQPVWEDRTLGSNRDVRIPIRTVWGLTANNVQMSQELTRRSVWIRLDANSERPWERTEFRHPNLMAWVRANRDHLVTAALTLVEAWIGAERPAYQGRAKGSYESWAAVIGGILQTVGIGGFLDNEHELYERVTSKADMLSDFVKAWWEKFGSEATSAYSLFQLASFADSDAENQLSDWRNLLGELLGSGNQRARQIRLGRVLGEHQDKIVSGYKILHAKTANGMKYWELQPVEYKVEYKDSYSTNDNGSSQERKNDSVEYVEYVEYKIDPHACKEKNIFLTSNGSNSNNLKNEKKNVSTCEPRSKDSTYSTNGHEKSASTGGSESVEYKNAYSTYSTETEVTTWTL